MTLQFVKPSPDPHLNVLLYGPAKSGKTVGATSVPGPVLLLNGDTTNATRYAHLLHGDQLREVRFEGLETLIDAANAVESGDYASVVLDPIGDIHRIILEGLSKRAVRPSMNQYGDTTTHLERFCRALCEKPLNAVFVAHETASRDETSGGFEHLPWTGTSNPALGAKLMAMVDVIGYTGVVEQEGGGVKFMAQLITGRGRRGGDRFGVLGTTREIDIGEWINLTKAATAPQAVKERKAA